MTDDPTDATAPDLTDSGAASVLPGPVPVLTRPHLPIVLVIDTSSSMRPYLDDLHEAVTAALDVAWSDIHGPTVARIAVVTAGGRAEVAVPLAAPTDPGSLPPFRAEGPADVGGAIDLLGSAVEALTVRNLDAGRRTLPTAIVLVSDGRWERGDAALAIERLHAPPTRPTVHTVGVGDLDETTLARVATGAALAVDTPGDLDTTLTALMRACLAQAASDTPDQPVAVGTPLGSRPLEGW